MTLGRLFRLVSLVARVVIPRSRSERTAEDSQKLLVDTKVDEESLRDDIRSIAETLRAGPVNRGSYNHPDIPDILENVALANWDPQASLPLNESDAQRVLNALQQVRILSAVLQALTPNLLGTGPPVVCDAATSRRLSHQKEPPPSAVLVRTQDRQVPPTNVCSGRTRVRRKNGLRFGGYE